MKQPPFGYDDKVLLTQAVIPHLLQLALRRGGQSHRLLSGTSLFEADLQKPQHRTDLRTWLTLLKNCQQLQSPELPFLTASAVLQHSNLPLCQLLDCAANLRQALRCLSYYRHQLMPFVYARIAWRDQMLRIELHAAAGLQGQADFMFQLMLSLLLQLIRHQLPGCPPCQIELPQAAPRHPTASDSLWQQPVHYNQPVAALLLPIEVLDLPFRGADRPRFLQLKRFCRQQNQLLPRRRGLLEYCQQQLRRSLPTPDSQLQLAAGLGLSSSSLKRLLQQHQSSYSQLLDDCRHLRAQQLVSQHPYSNRQLASLLGYSDEHNFRRAFKRWTGLLPSHFRDLLLR